MQNDVLKYELEKALMLTDAKLVELNDAIKEFQTEITEKNGYTLSRALHSWREQYKQYELLRNIYQADWNDDTKFE
jgi:hypothetical protein